jgi:asparagine synthase (glutamine-hydrolysing)
MFQHIRKLPPAHTLVCEQGNVKLEKYWNLSYLPKVKINEHEIKERISDLIEESVKIRMISDVPIGGFLSGGIDSSIVIALMSLNSSQPIKTFSIGFEEKEFNELPYARIIAERYNTEHHEFIVKPNAVEILPKLVWQFDEPFGDSSAIPTYYLSEMTGQYVKVALNGDGGDESFAGYLRYLGYKLVRYHQKIPYTFRHRALTPLLNILPDNGERGYVYKLLRRLKVLNDLSFEPQQNLYARTLIIFQNALKLQLFSDDVRNQFLPINSLNYMLQYLCSNYTEHFTDDMLYSDVMTYLPGDLLVKMDRMTMAHGVEGRSPFLDHILMEFVA